MIKGEVARVLSDSEVILNVGSDDGVKQDMKFIIFSEGDHIFDPETGEDLGAIETVKGRLTVVHVMEKMSRAKTFTYQAKVPSSYEAIGGLFGGARTVTRRYKLKVHQHEVRPIDEDLIVRVGDKVRSV